MVVVDEAFADFLPGAPSLAMTGLPGVVCVRSLTKLWGLAGLRVGYLLGPVPVLERAAAALQPWPVNALAARAVELLSAPAAEPERARRAEAVRLARERLVRALGEVPGTRVWPSPANFVLVQAPVPDLRGELLTHGLAVRRCRSFPGLTDRFARIAVPLDLAVQDRLVEAVTAVVAAGRA